jgi:glycosyltransferase involved in cell wall biosynthesis
MAAGTPVVCSNAASLPEVGRDAAIYFDPKDPVEGAAALIEALSRGPELVSKGLEHSSGYSWDRTMKGHLACYRELLA